MVTDQPSRVAIVTGASSGIGRAIAVALGAAGHRVAIGARRVDALAQTAEQIDGGAFAHPLDVTDSGSVDAFFTAVESSLGPVDILVNNAGVAWPGKLHEVDDDVHDRIVATNLLGPIHMARRAIRSMLARDDLPVGDLVWISSDASRHPRPYLASYGATKTAVEHLADVVGMELEGTNIRSTAVRVGPTISDFGNAWDPSVFEYLLTDWPKFGLQRHWGAMDPATVGAAVVHCLAMPVGAHSALIELQPTAISQLDARSMNVDGG